MRRIDTDRLATLLKEDEGLRLKPYRDSVGKLTIGYGRNLEDNGITQWEADVMLANDLGITMQEAYSAFPWFRYLDEVRQDVVLSMLFNMGMPRLTKFKKMLSAIADRNYELAAAEMLNSKWASQVGRRAQKLASMMRSGDYPSRR